MRSNLDPNTERKWYCVQTQANREHVVAAHLRDVQDVETFCPRVRFKRASRGGLLSSVTEALFPGYLFARFEFAAAHRMVRYAHGVRGIIQFGQDYATIADHVVDELRGQMEAQDIKELPMTLREGSSVQIMAGSFQGLNAVVVKFFPAKDRVKVLLEFLGRQMEAEVPVETVLSRYAHPLVTSN